MSTTAIYEHGVLRPLTPLNLREHEVVSVSVDAVPANGVPGPEEELLFDIFDEAGLIGCIHDGPTDLSTNPKHMEGFGKRGE